jgi:hypothetical protein
MVQITRRPRPSRLALRFRGSLHANGCTIKALKRTISIARARVRSSCMQSRSAPGRLSEAASPANHNRVACFGCLMFCLKLKRVAPRSSMRNTSTLRTKSCVCRSPFGKVLSTRTDALVLPDQAGRFRYMMAKLTLHLNVHTSNSLLCKLMEGQPLSTSKAEIAVARSPKTVDNVQQRPLVDNLCKMLRVDLSPSQVCPTMYQETI